MKIAFTEKLSVFWVTKFFKQYKILEKNEMNLSVFWVTKFFKQYKILEKNVTGGGKWRVSFTVLINLINLNSFKKTKKSSNNSFYA